MEIEVRKAAVIDNGCGGKSRLPDLGHDPEKVGTGFPTRSCP